MTASIESKTATLQAAKGGAAGGCDVLETKVTGAGHDNANQKEIKERANALAITIHCSLITNHV